MNGTSNELGGDNVTGSQFDTNEYGAFGRHEFLQLNPWIAIPSIIVLAVASLGGTFGNVLTLLAVAFSGKIRHVEKTFIVNLALSDLYVTAIADPMSIVGKLSIELNICSYNLIQLSNDGKIRILIPFHLISIV